MSGDNNNPKKRYNVDISSAIVLVVDDDAMNVKLAKKMLEGHFGFMGVRSGKQALEVLENTIPDLVLLDVHMPEMSGHDVIRRMKADERWRDIPVIFLTADNDDETEIKSFDEGALDYIRKPFRKGIALQRIQRILELSYLQHSLSSEVEKQTRKAIERGEKIDRLSKQLVITLANAIDAKDKYTNGHSARVEKYSMMIGRRMGYDDEMLSQLSYAAMLHDVGKIGIPDSIINKPTELTDAETEVVKKHPQIGSEILKQITELPNIAHGARWHHERYDGKGYPDGLMGEEIPQIARVIGVADAYDAMASKRSYRDVLPQEVVRSEIEKGLGTQFDPEIARIMLDIIDEDIDYVLHE